VPPESTARTTPNRRFTVLLSMALYVASCSLPALMLHTGGYVYAKDLTPGWKWSGHESVRGAELLFSGWFGLMVGNFAVLANPALWLSWLLFGLKNDRGATASSAVALLVAMLTFQLSVQPYYFDEAGAKRGYLESPQIGFVCWIASMVLILVASIYSRRATPSADG
jgi:hypothetical protein